MEIEGYTVARSEDDAVSRAAAGDCHEFLEDARQEAADYAPEWSVYEVSIKSRAKKV